ncbi:hypothetical protein ACFQ3J_08300 [Paenibacillus provencensis]|uniref:Uncharacterized protein n=1 Tax=Paenibacillus provencensis TaxID=441151 RepID=A0ABW3PRT8_9BACL|nr:hypothetical protein [Paenibacillus sp. MER 78]MCM3129108.1 hypothetical protein [Paenibacillus sp. MER 78]
MMKIQSKMILLLLLTFAIAGCAQTNEADPVPEPGVDQGIVEPNEPEVEVKEAKGTLTGLADPHTVEIVIDGEPTAFQLGEGMQAAIAEVGENSVLEFKYEERPIEGEDTLQQRVLIEIISSAQGSEGPDTAEPKTPGDERPSVTEVELQLEGMTEQKEAELVKAADGYSLYVFDIFTFNPETGVLSMDVDPSYEVKIGQQSGDTELAQLKEEGMTKLSAFGAVEELEHDSIHDASLFLKVREEATGDSYEYIVKDMDGTWFIYEVAIPQGEPTEGFKPHAYASINTIELDQ